MDKIISILQMLLGSPAGSFAFVLAFILLALWLVHWVTKKITRIQTTNEMLEKENTKTCEKLEKHAEKVDKNMDEIRRDISFLKAMVDVYNRPTPPEALAKSHSPVSLTEKGKEVSENLGAEEMIAKNWEKIFNILEKDVCDKNAYDIQEYCIETSIVELDKFIDAASIEKVKLYAYKAGQPIAYYAPIFGISIRDRYLAEKGISVEEVDKNNPHLNTNPKGNN